MKPSARRNPYRKTSTRGAAKLALIKSKAGRAQELLKQLDDKSFTATNIYDLLDQVIELCEGDDELC